MSEPKWTPELENEIRRILREYQTYDPDHFGMIYVSSYQIAIELSQSQVVDLNKPIGGRGAGSHSIANYIANELSKRIKSDEITDIEEAWLSNQHANEVSFKFQGQDIIATGGTHAVISMFRISD